MSTVAVGRNDPCPCGSGQKFKKCCQGKQSESSPSSQNARQEQALQRFQAGDFAGALQLCEQLLSNHPELAKAQGLAGLSLHQMGQHAAAEQYLRTALHHEPSSGMFYNLGVVLQAQAKLDEAEACYRQSITLQTNADALGNLGGLLHKQGRFDEAIEVLTRTLEIRPDDAGAHNNLALALLAIGQSSLGLQHLQQALALKSPYEEAHSSLIFAMDIAPGITLAQQLAERRRWNQLYTANIAPHQQHANCPDPERRLRIAYVSADLWRHSAWSVFSAMLLHFDRSNFEVYVYANSHKQDDATDRLKASVTAWRNIADLSNTAAAELIRADEIDILVDLSGHSLGNRLLVFAQKPAPVQVTAWGYASSTGLAAMDVFFADPVTVPPEEKPLYAEEVRYLPNHFCANFPDPFPPANALPALTNGYITFGSFNRLCKLSDPALRLWAHTLQAQPNSRLLIKTPELEHGSIRDYLHAQFAALGVDNARVELLGKSSWHEHVAMFNRVDMVLDPLPHGGGVSTLEALMMGVPVITLSTPTIAGRLSATIQNTLGLSDWIADTPQAYLDLAMKKPADLAALAQLRSELRARIEASVLMDYAAYNRAVEAEYRSLWRAWCARSA